MTTNPNRKATMTDQRATPSRRPAKNNTQAVKILITTASLTAIVGGWAFYTQQNAQGSPDTAAVDPAPAQMVELPPLPTLVPEPGQLTTQANAAVLAGALPPAIPGAAMPGAPLVPTPLPTAGPLPTVSAPKNEIEKPVKQPKQKATKPTKSGNTGSSKP
jgi:hypothetical protein